MCAGGGEETGHDGTTGVGVEDLLDEMTKGTALSRIDEVGKGIPGEVAALHADERGVGTLDSSGAVEFGDQEVGAFKEDVHELEGAASAAESRAVPGALSWLRM